MEEHASDVFSTLIIASLCSVMLLTIVKAQQYSAAVWMVRVRKRRRKKASRGAV